MHGPGCDLLARAAFSGEQHGDTGLRYPAQEFAHIVHGPRGAQQSLQAAGRAHFGFQSGQGPGLVGLSQGAGHRGAQAHLIKGLAHKVHGTSLEAVVQGGFLGAGRQHYDREGTPSQFVQQLAAISIWQTQIQEDSLHRFPAQESPGLLQGRN